MSSRMTGKEIMLNRNFKRVNQEIEDMIKELLGMS